MKIQKTDNNIYFKSTPEQKLATKIGEYVLSQRRQFEQGPLLPKYRDYLLNSIMSVVMPFIKKGDPIPMAIIGFPGKSPNRLRTISSNADRAEYESLKHLTMFTNGISNIYEPGAKLDIYSDGRVFVNIINGRDDNIVSKYLLQIKKFLEKLKTSNVKIHTLEDYYSGSFDSIRNLLEKDFPSYPPDFSNAFIKRYIDGMKIFYGRDIRALPAE